MEKILKALDFEVKQVGDPADRVLEFIGSTAAVDRYGDIIEVSGWQLANYKKNPVFLFGHNYSMPPIGKAVKVEKGPDALTFQIKFATAEEYAFADTIYRLYLGGFLKATSVGFQDIVREPILAEPDGQGYAQQTGWRYKKQELYELSAVTVPANPEALIMAVKGGAISEKEGRVLGEINRLIGDLKGFSPEPPAPPEEGRGVIPFKEYPTADPGMKWDGPAQVAASDVAGLKVICTWFDSAAPDVKGSYKLPHHQAKGYMVVWKGVAAAMGALLGAQGGVDVPEGDRKGIYNHLAKHYAQFEKTPPDFKEYTDLEIRLIEIGLSFNMEEHRNRTLEGLLDLVEELEARVPGEEKDEAHTRAGAVLSAKNKKALQDAQVLIQQVLDAATPPEAGADNPGRVKNYYPMALNPGEEPHGGKPAKGAEADQAALAEIHKLTQTLRNTLK
jgi:HK97 family phage prohead protease